MTRLKDAIYHLLTGLLHLLSLMLCRILKDRYVPGSVLHVSFTSHIPRITVDILRANGVKADYLAVTDDEGAPADFVFHPKGNRILAALREFAFFWRVIARYEIIHSYFGRMPSGALRMERYLKQMGRKFVIHFRGCDLRSYSGNKRINPQYNICDECDYGRTCELDGHKEKLRHALEYGDACLVTTPDMLDFLPEAIYIPFFAPDVPEPQRRRIPKQGEPLRIVHITNHEGIDGTREIKQAVNELRENGYNLQLEHLSGVTYDEVMAAYTRAHLSIGKMKMGFYANSQIESMCHGVPAITYMREDYITDEHARSGFILTSPARLEQTLQHYLDNPEELQHKMDIARDTVLSLHDNRRIAEQMIVVYKRITE